MVLRVISDNNYKAWVSKKTKQKKFINSRRTKNLQKTGNKHHYSRVNNTCKVTAVNMRGELKS